MLDPILGLAASVALLPVIVLLAQVLLGLLGPRRLTQTQGERPTIAVLVPAHNEAAGIADTLALLLPQLTVRDRLVVVADNCTDATAAIARAATTHATGAEVIERLDGERRGKGYALDFGLRHLGQDPPALVLTVDADCRVDPGALDMLAHVCGQTGRPVQALYLMCSPEGAGLKTRIAEFAWLVKNQARPLGMLRLGLPCQLMGTGMAFPWQLAVQMNLANANIVEDMKLGVDLALLGHPALFCPDARVTSLFPTADAAVKTQRTRWEHGHLSLILQEVPRLLVAALVRADIGVLGLALDLLVPPLALLTTLLVVVFALTALSAWLGLSALPLLLSTAAVGLMLIAVLIAWHGWGRRVVSLVDLLTVPFYVLAKMPLYLKFWTRRQKEWIRTDRE
jgi:cellulose synthase/poly-beta-1,6-N-acetylglucosamine synthase-like glycosyltransferase